MQGCQHENKNMGEVILQIPLLVQTYNIFKPHRIGGVMGSMLASSAVDRGFEPRSGSSSSH